MDLGLKGKTALITGASKGIGLACAETLAAEGCHVILISRGQEALNIAKQRIQAAHPSITVTTYSFDLSLAEHQAQVAAMAADCDILVNNAGSNPSGLLTDTTDTGWRQSFDLKMFGYVNLTRAALEAMKIKKRGVIINVIGYAGERLMAKYIIGTTANAGLMAFTRSVGSESPDYGVRVVGVNPALTKTERGEKLLKLWSEGTDGQKLTEQEVLAKMNLPFGRMATSEEVADAVAFLASDRASYISGIVLNIDGGGAFRL
jgi:NAD(P)-dependent dehydrogenase (short-subunit alcohol dehydrogenase family)